MHKIKWDKFCQDHHKYEKMSERESIYDESEEKELPCLIENAKGQGMIHRDSIIVLQGKPKQGKSTAALCFVMAIMKGEFNGLKAREDNCKVLWIDTEMGRRESKRRLRGAMDSIDLDKNSVERRLEFLPLKTIPKDERIDSVERNIEDFSPDFVVLDGVADLVRDINNADECAKVMERLGIIVEQRHIALLTLIHENKQDAKSRGHLGSSADQKAFGLYSVKNGKVDYLFGRGETCEGFSFGFGEGGIPAPAVEVVRNEWTECMEKWAEVFKSLPDGGKRDSGYKNKELQQGYTTKYRYSPRTAQDAIKSAVSKGVLLQNGEGQKTVYKLCFNNIDNDEDL